MHRYLLKFSKTGNMRFISHLDLGRLFKRAIRKAGISIGFSNGFNPHELINIVQPLSLGYESKCEYFEMDTTGSYIPEQLTEQLNSSMPDGIRFYSCKEIQTGSVNMSGRSEFALYEAVLPPDCGLTSETVSSFLNQNCITIIKKDKKTKKPVEKDIKNFIYEFSQPELSENGMIIKMTLRCASNETLNPGKLLESLIRYASLPLGIEYVKIIRLDILGKNPAGILVPLYEI